MSIEKESCVPCRDKYWSELDIEEKIERMRGIAKSQEERLGSLQESFYRIHAFIEKHSHDNNGKLLMRIDGDELRQVGGFPFPPRETLSRNPGNKDEAYF